MAELWKDGPDHYGTGDVTSDAVARMIEGAWAEVGNSNSSLSLSIPSFEQEGRVWLVMPQSDIRVSIVRRIIGGPRDEIFAAFRIRLSQLPINSGSFFILRDGANNDVAGIGVTSTGGLFVTNSAGSTIATTSGPALVAATNHHIEIRAVRDAAAGVVEIRVDEVEVLNATGLALGDVSFEQVALLRVSNTAKDTTMYFRDIILRDSSGTTNNTFMGDLRVTAIPVVADGVAQGWTARARKNLGTGILDLRAASNAAVGWTDPPVTAIGTSDYTLETFVRFSALPTGTDKAHILGRWRESTNERMIQLFRGGPDLESGNLVFRVSTDGTPATVTNIHSVPWVPDLDVWYHVAVSRTAGVNRLFVNGVQLGTDKADALAYFVPSANARPTFGAQQNALTSTLTGTGVDGFMDEVRITIGTGRYTANFAVPTEKFPRDNTDPAWNDVSLLLGFDNGSIADEGPQANSTTAISGALAFDPDDGEFAYQSISQLTPRDDTFIEAALVPATGTLTLTDNPADTETVSIEEPSNTTTKVYTFAAAVGAANTVLIGVDAAASLNNLRAAINGEAGEGTLYGTGTVAHVDVSASVLPNDTQLVVTAKTPGVSGNAIDTTETLAAGSWSGTTLAGGVDIPGVSEFVLGPLPPGVTGVRSISIINRGFKSDEGSSEVQLSFVTEGGSADAGTARPLTIDPSYREDIFERDPATLGAITPATLNGSRIRINRTL